MIHELCSQSVGLPIAAIRSRVIINDRISGCDHQRQDWGVIINGSLCDTRTVCDPQSVGLPNAATRSRVIIYEWISESDHPRQDEESDHKR